MSMNDELGKRMKEFYESVPKTHLMRRTPVALRIDGRSFHTFTRGFMRPFDEILIQSMQDTMLYLCKEISGCVLGYHQSDEITLILCDYQTLTTDAWFGYEVQKLCSVAASMATMKFNQAFNYYINPYWFNQNYNITETWQYHDSLMRAADKGATFDARCFNIPKEEVCNLIYWRQLDATRNSIQMVGQANFSHKELQGKSCNEIQEMLWSQKGINWNDLSTYKKRGSCCVKVAKDGCAKWTVDKDIPIFAGEGRNYIERLVENPSLVIEKGDL